MTDLHPGGMPPQLKKYWLAGKGLARWSVSPKPYTALVAALRSEGVPEKAVHGLAANLYHAHFGVWPGKHERGGGGPSSAVKLTQRSRR